MTEVLANFAKDMKGDKDCSDITTWQYRFINVLIQRSVMMMFVAIPLVTVITATATKDSRFGEKHVSLCPLLCLLLYPWSMSSLSSNLISDKQSSILSDALKLSLYFAFNKRRE